MRVTKYLAVLLVPALLMSLPHAAAQDNEIAVGIGGNFPVNSPGASNAVAISGSVAHRLFGVPMVSLYAEVPVVGTLGADVRTAGLLSPGSYSSLYVAPGVKLKIGSSFPVSPYFVVGGGLAHFSKSSSVAAASGSDTSTNTGVIDMGGGVDMKLAPHVALRGEVRDFYSGSPALTIPALRDRQHNLVVSAGLVLRW